MLGWTGALLITVVSEIMLGYASSDDITQLAWHIPLGVAVPVFALVTTLLAYGLALNRHAA